MEFVAAFILALLVSLLFAVRSRKGASLTQALVFFFILFMAGIAGQYWIIPFGPVLWGVSWMPLLFIVLIVTLLFASPSPRQHPVKETENDRSVQGAVVISLLLWILLLLLLIAVVVGYSKRHHTDIPEKPDDITLIEFNESWNTIKF